MTRTAHAQAHAAAPDVLSLGPGVGFAPARAHEAAGPARATLALMLAARTRGPVLWLRPRWTAERLMGDGVARWLDPGRLIFGEARTAGELLWAAEEALRTGLVPLIVAELPVAPSLTPVRRLHLAAEAGAGRGAAPLVLLLTPGAGGAAGIETRWIMTPAPGWARDGAPRWRLTRARARTAPTATWEVWIAGGALGLERSPEPETAA